MNVGEYIGSPCKFIEGRNVPGLLTSNHNVGVEIEIENIRYDFSSEHPVEPDEDFYLGVDNRSELPELGPHWYIVKDNSLRSGVEFIFSGPKKGGDIVDALNSMNSFFSVFRRNGRPVSASDRCSVHVHLDVRDLSEQRLNRLIMLYVLVERILFEYVSPSRLKNNYCRPVTDSSFKHILNAIDKKANPSEFGDVISIIRSNCDKYSALNLLPIQSYGTVEFRHHQGTSNMEEVLDWINIILAIKLASDTDPHELISIYKYYGFKGLIQRIFEGTVIAQDQFLNRPILQCITKKGMNDYLEILGFNELKEKTEGKPVCSLSFDLLNLFANENKIFPVEEKKPSPRVRKAMHEDLFMGNSAWVSIHNNIISQFEIPPPPSPVPISALLEEAEDEDDSDETNTLEDSQEF